MGIGAAAMSAPQPKPDLGGAPAAPSGTTLVLASASPARRTVLRAAGIDPVVRISDVDEQALQQSMAGSPPADIVLALATAKATAVAAGVRTDCPDAVVIGCDSMMLVDGELYGKPVDEAAAREQWRRMAGGTTELLTGHCVLRLTEAGPDSCAADVERTTIRFGSPSIGELDAYLATGEPLHVAGSLTIDGYGGWFVDGIDGDPSSVIGISLPLTRRLLHQVGVRVTDLWNMQPRPVQNDDRARATTSVRKGDAR